MQSPATSDESSTFISHSTCPVVVNVGRFREEHTASGGHSWGRVCTGYDFSKPSDICFRIAGISTAIALRNQLHYENFMVKIHCLSIMIEVLKPSLLDIRESFDSGRNMEGA
jgi:hypothetical protein